MPMPKSDAALGDARGFMDQAINSDKGWRVFFLTRQEAWTYRQRCYAVRSRELKTNAKLYPSDDIMHTQTVYHRLMFVIEQVELEKGMGLHWALSARHGDSAYLGVGLGNQEIK